MNRREMLATTVALGAGFAMMDVSKAAEALSGQDPELKKWLLEECKMEYNHVGIPTDQNLKWDTYLDNIKVHIMEYENDPFGIEWMQFEDDSPFPECIRKRPHVAFKIANFDEVIKKFKLLVPVSQPRPWMKTCFIEHKGIGIEFISK
ncbi:MAG: hypothetical protein Q4C70_03635 [Planctomycetia bacterium]|nr:hypothetical protein [Planctomycetia bacterium]